MAVNPMKVATTHFHACRPKLWHGRYARIMGESPVFHLRYVEGRLWPVLVWKLDEEIATCRAIACAAAIDLAKAVTQAKRHAGGGGGGAFVINEYGQVIVPSTDGGGARYLAGHLSGQLLFMNPFFPEEPIDLADHERLENGDPWKLPYVGIPYNLHRNGSIYFYDETEVRGRCIFPPHQDYELIRAIRYVRPSGAVRILVNPAGSVLTKVAVESGQQSEDCWQPVFVGSINRNLWFEKE